MKLVLVRHGRPDEADPTRPHDPPLRADGREQAEAVAERLALEGITRIVCSPLLRALQTAQPLADRIGVPIDIMDGWAEADRHLERYRSTETLRALGKSEWSRFLADPVGYLGGDEQTFKADVLAALAASFGDRNAHVAVFCHGLPINVVLSHALGLARIVHFAPGYGSMTRLRLGAAGAVGVSSVNERNHLAPEASLP